MRTATYQDVVISGLDQRLQPTDEMPPGITRVPVLFVNAYVVDVTPGVPDDGWVIVDTGLRGLGALELRRIAASRYGAHSKPQAIVLTHGHFDHAGSAEALNAWAGVPIYAHQLEVPYLTDRSDYPPQDPTVGGALAMMSRAFPRGALNLRGSVRSLPADGSVPALPGWRAVHTPGHTAGHVSFWRESDRVLLAGDAMATMNQESWVTMVTMPRELRWPPIPLTTDWDAARDSILELATLRPNSIAAGHGLPMSGGYVADALNSLAQNFQRPGHGRYVVDPARADERGVTYVPPPVPDPVGVTLRTAAASAAAAAVVVTLARTRRRA